MKYAKPTLSDSNMDHILGAYLDALAAKNAEDERWSKPIKRKEKAVAPRSPTKPFAV